MGSCSSCKKKQEVIESSLKTPKTEPEKANKINSKNSQETSGEKGLEKKNMKTDENKKNITTLEVIQEPETSPSKTIRFSSLVRSNEELLSIEKDFESYLISPNIGIDEKLRLTLLLLRKTTEPTDDSFKDDTSTKEFILAFTGLIEKHYHLIVERFTKGGKGYKPLIKLIQIFELMLENFKENEEHKRVYREFLIRNFMEITKKFSEFDWRLLKKLQDVRENLGLEPDTSRQDLFLSGFTSRLEKIREILIWKTEKKCFKYVEKVIESLLTLRKENNIQFLECLTRGRFEKNRNKNLSSSLLLAMRAAFSFS